MADQKIQQESTSIIARLDHTDEYMKILISLIKEMQETQKSIDALHSEIKENKSFSAFALSIVLVLVMAGVLSMSLIAILGSRGTFW